ncbi:MAG TPA: shikimate dehydrogenase [Burkholderiales bacterium]|nr:shikimate dehydrogenase [Burkholderiales bacterium]
MAERYAVIGHPIAHSRSPWIHARFARATGEDIEYGRIDAGPEEFAGAVERFRRAGGKGLNVTVPHKEAAFRLSSERSARASTAEAVNTLVLGEAIFGDNTDGAGLVRDIEVNQGYRLRGRATLLLGAGGAARGVVGALLEAGVARLVIGNRTVERARELARRFPPVAACGYGELGGERFDLIVNATSAGLQNAALPLPAPLFSPRVLAYEMVYGRETPFLATARAAGARACDGLGMLVEQAAESFLVWRGVRPDTGPILAALRAELRGT